MFPSVIKVTHFVCGLHTQACIYVCDRMLPSVINVTHFVCGLHTQACIRMRSDVTECYQCYPLCMWSTHTGLHTNVTQCYRLLPSVINVTHFVCGHTGLHTYVTNVTQCYRMLPSDYGMFVDEKWLVLYVWVTVLWHVCGGEMMVLWYVSGGDWVTAYGPIPGTAWMLHEPVKLFYTVIVIYCNCPALFLFTVHICLHVCYL